jgi:uncharacterized iron-regulated membrane protein
MTLKKLFGQLHLLLGLTSGMVVFIVALTGCLIVFEEEFGEIFDYGVYKKVAKQDIPFALPSKIFSVADSALEGKEIRKIYYTVFLDENRVNVLWARDSSRQYHALLQNPYTGEVAGDYNYKTSFFTIMTFIHTSLALGDVGSTIIRYTTLIFVILMITGLVLWKPASKKGYKQRFTIKWNATGKRLNYDLHNVLGFYMSWIAIFIAFTGLVWSFEWFENGVSWLANGGKNLETTQKEYLSSPISNVDSAHQVNLLKNMDIAFESALHNRQNNARVITITKPESDSATIELEIQTKTGSNYERADIYHYDQYSGKLLGVNNFSSLTNAEKLNQMNFYIHVGKIGGLAGKFLAFFASLTAASLPITGFIIWRGRKRKSNQQAGNKVKTILPSFFSRKLKISND